MTERSTRRTSLRRNLPVASSTYARDTARPGRHGVRSKIFATQRYWISDGRNGSRSTKLRLSTNESAVHSNSRHSRSHRFPPLRADFVAKLESCRATIFRKKTEREVIADSYNLNRITKVACELVARR